MDLDVKIDCSCTTFPMPTFTKGHSSCCHLRLLKKIIFGVQLNDLPCVIHHEHRIKKCQEHATKMNSSWIQKTVSIDSRSN